MSAGMYSRVTSSTSTNPYVRTKLGAPGRLLSEQCEIEFTNKPGVVGLWCNGSMAGSLPVDRGSTPRSPTTKFLMRGQQVLTPVSYAGWRELQVLPPLPFSVARRQGGVPGS